MNYLHTSEIYFHTEQAVISVSLVYHFGIYLNYTYSPTVTNLSISDIVYKKFCELATKLFNVIFIS